ncbi:hypothetical protein JTB14_012856 [Gonioctena quinquepunctata]|nr:hypothetical protein JTB14_012856 [Gonioctena quinquepunctata]
MSGSLVALEANEDDCCTEDSDSDLYKVYIPPHLAYNHGVIAPGWYDRLRRYREEGQADTIQYHLSQNEEPYASSSSTIRKREVKSKKT